MNFSNITASESVVVNKQFTPTAVTEIVTGQIAITGITAGDYTLLLGAHVPSTIVNGAVLRFGVYFGHNAAWTASTGLNLKSVALARRRMSDVAITTNAKGKFGVAPSAVTIYSQTLTVEIGIAALPYFETTLADFPTLFANNSVTKLDFLDLTAVITNNTGTTIDVVANFFIEMQRGQL